AGGSRATSDGHHRHRRRLRGQRARGRPCVAAVRRYRPGDVTPRGVGQPSARRSRRRMPAGAAANAATAGGSLLPLAILLPALGVLMSLLLGGRRGEWIALGLMPVEFAVAVAITCFVWRSAQPLVYTLAGYTPPLGIALRADGFSAVMLVTAGLG